MCFFPRNRATFNDSLCFFIYQGILFPLSGKVSSGFCYFHKVEMNTKTDRNLWKTFLCKIVIFSFPQNVKCYTSKFCFHKMERYFIFISKEWKILEAETEKFYS